MRRNVLLILGAAALVWGVLAIVLGSASLKLGAGSSPSPACLPASVEHSAALAGTGVYVSPAPETGTANPATQISFLGAPAAQLHGLSVVGRSSGPHPGRLLGYSQGDGASFQPARPFQAGEQVSVHATVGSGASARALAFQFRLDTPYPTASVPEFPAPPASPADSQSFYTLPGVQAPVMTVTTPDRDPAAGQILLTNGPGPGQYGPLIYSPQGRLLWFGKLSGTQAAENLSVQSYEGARALTWWKGRVLSLGFGQGEDLIMDSHYRTLATVKGGNGLPADLHDFQLASRGVAYVTAYNPILCNLAPVEGSKRGAIVDTAVQAIDIHTGLVRWEWHSLDHIGPAETEVEVPKSSTPWDYFHLNSIDVQPGGGLLLSARSTWAGYLLQAGTGKVLWRLGGNRSSFKMGPGTTMAWQHDARLIAGGEVTFFDDGSNPPIHSQSRALRIKLDLKTHRATLAASLTHHDPALLAASQGNAQTLPSGNTLVGYGGVPAISEYAEDGTLLFDANQPYDTTFYRAYRFPWSARPASPPSVLANYNNTEEETIVHTSWNGATDVASWRILAGQQPGSLSPQATIVSRSFESATTLPRRYAYAAVQALDASGRVIGGSPATRTIGFYASLTLGKSG